MKIVCGGQKTFYKPKFVCIYNILQKYPVYKNTVFETKFSSSSISMKIFTTTVFFIQDEMKLTRYINYNIIIKNTNFTILEMVNYNLYLHQRKFTISWWFKDINNNNTFEQKQHLQIFLTTNSVLFILLNIFGNLAFSRRQIHQ